MAEKISGFIKEVPERFFGNLFARIFWPPPSVAVLAYGEHGDVLVLELDGSYFLPGGIIDAGEHPEKAAKREIKEETGFEVDINNILDIRRHQKGGFTVFYEAEIKGGEKRGTWEGEPRFIEKREIEDLEWSSEHSHVPDYISP